MDDEVLLLEMYKVQVQRSEHYEDQHSKFSNLLLLIVAGLLGFVAIDNELDGIDVLIGITLLFLGLFSYGSSKIHYERTIRHGKTAAQYRNKLDALNPAAQINQLRKEVNAPKRLFRIHHLWYGSGILISFVGAILIMLATISA